MVPPHIEAGTRIVVKPEDASYVERGTRKGWPNSRIFMAQSALINVIFRAAEKAARGLVRDFGEVENLQITRKGVADFVSTADTDAEKAIMFELKKARPDWGFIMEEGGVVKGTEDPEGPSWIIDPLDGTTNYLHGIPHFAISIAAIDKPLQKRRQDYCGRYF